MKKRHIFFTPPFRQLIIFCLSAFWIVCPAVAFAQIDDSFPFNDDSKSSASADSTIMRNPMTISGTLSATASTQWADCDFSTSPLALASFANFNIQYKGYNIPIHFNILDVSAFNLGHPAPSSSKGSLDMLQSLTRRLPAPKAALGITPKFGGTKLHLGASSMKFSPYIYSGVQFLGGGIEFDGKWFRFGTFAGVLNRPTRYRELDTRSALQQYADSLLGLNTYETMRPQFRRDAIAFKLGFGSIRNGVDLMAMKAKDIDNTLPEIIPWGDSTINRNMLVSPKENLALGISGRFMIARKFSVKGNLAASVFTPNTLVDSLDSERIISTYDIADATIEKGLSLLEKASWLYQVQGNTRLRLAGDVAAQLKLKHFNIGGQYRFIQADYTSLGIISNLQNLKSMGVSGGFNILQGALTVSASAYGQQDNLNRKQLYTNSVYNYNLNANALFGTIASVVFSGNLIHQTQDNGTRVVDPETRIDQTTLNLNLTPSVHFEGVYDHQLALNLNILSTDNHNKLLISDLDCRTTSIGPNYECSINKGRLILDASYDFGRSLSQYSNYDAHTFGIGGLYRIAGNATNKLTTRLSTSLSFNNIKSQGSVADVLDMNTRMGFIKTAGYEVTEMKTTSFDITSQLTWTSKKGHTATARISLRNFSNREMIAQKVSTTLNISASLSYSYTFMAKLQKKKQKES